MRRRTEILTRLAGVWAMFGGLALLAIIAVTVTSAGAVALDRVARLFGENVGGLPGYEDFVRLAIGAAAPMFLPYCQARGGHLAVDVFTAGAGERATAALDAIGQAGIAAAAFFLAYWMTYGMIETYEDNALSRVLGWPEWPAYLTGIASLAFWGVVAANQAFDRARDALRDRFEGDEHG